MRAFLWPFYVILVLTGMRERMRCPACQAVGTYKLHPPCVGSRGQPRPFRWLCKWCGFYKGPEGKGRLCYPSRSERVWAFFDDALLDTSKETPQDVLRRELAWVWPWRG